jgi:hypothetical protein
MTPADRLPRQFPFRIARAYCLPTHEYELEEHLRTALATAGAALFEQVFTQLQR